MEDVLAVYHLPYDPLDPVVCMDESSKQLIGEVHAPIAPAPGRGAIIDHEYVRNGTAQIFVEVEPLAGRRHVEVTESRTRKDWAAFIKAMLDERYPDAIRVRLVMDNLNTHDHASLYAAFEPGLARSLAERLEIHYTSKHGSWLNIAEIELSAMLEPAHPGHTNHEAGNRSLAKRSKHTRSSRQLAVHKRASRSETQSDLSESSNVTGY